METIQANKSPENQREQQSSEPVMKVMESMIAELSNTTANNDVPGEIFCYEAMFPSYSGQPELHPLQVFKATADPDTMYMHEAMKEPDAEEFKAAMQKEWDDQLGNGNFIVRKRSELPEGATVLPAVWQMKQKCDIGQKQAGRVSNKYLTDILVNKVGFEQSKVDECIFYQGSTMYVLYTDDSILAGPDLDEINQVIKDIKAAKLDITKEGDIQDFLGIHIQRKEDGTIHLTQEPH